MYIWKEEVEENTQVPLWRKKVKRSSEKFALDEFITVFLAPRIGRRKTESAKIRGTYKVSFEMEIYQLALCYWLFSPTQLMSI